MTKRSIDDSFTIRFASSQIHGMRFRDIIIAGSTVVIVLDQHSLVSETMGGMYDSLIL